VILSVQKVAIGGRHVAGKGTSALLGALGGGRRDFLVQVFVPSLTRDGEEIDHNYWQRRTLEVMAGLFGGATAVEGLGAWRDDARDGHVGVEKTTTVFSYMAKPSFSAERISALRKFLHRMGREAKQGEVGLIVDGEYLGIQEFDDENAT
jgi:hypothetical protein